MARLSPEEINDIRTQADIVDIVSSYIPLTLKGKNYFGVCPFHDDHSPSMSVSKEKQMYKCFSCGAAGNVFKFVADFEHISFIEAVSNVASRVGITLDIKTTTSAVYEKYQEEYDIMDYACKFYQNNISTQEAKVAKEYLNSRNFTDETMNEFDIGVAFDQNTLHKILEKKGYSFEKQEQLGLISIKGERTYDMFMNRIMIPIHNEYGQAVGFTGRVFGAGNPRYLNTKETVIFKKGKVLFNYHRARDSVKLHKKLIIVEGNMDAIRMAQNGIKNVVALMGTQMTKDQISLIKKLKVPVTLMLDNDDAGFDATFQIGTMFEAEQITFQVVCLSKEKDPDDYIVQNGIEALKDNIEHAISFVEFRSIYFKKGKNLNDSEELLKYVKTMLSSLKQTNDDLLVEITLQKLSKEYELSYELLKQEFSKLHDKTDLPISFNVETKKVKKSSKEVYLGNMILYFMMQDGLYIDIFQRELGILTEKDQRAMAIDIIYYYDTHGNISLADFDTYIQFSPWKEQFLDIIKEAEDISINNEIMLEYVIAYKKMIHQREINDLKNELKNELDSNRKLEIAMKIQELKKEV